MVFDEYAQYYDLLYQDKDYIGEANYIDSLLQKYGHQPSALLELGCGTGKHAALLAAKGYSVRGLDLSAEMLVKANQRAEKNPRLTFGVADICAFNLHQTFDAAISLFHVMSYQNTDREFISVLHNVHHHLKEKGVFIFDCWYGPAVLLQRPDMRVKRLENETVKVTRIAEPVMRENENIVEVHYDVFVENKRTRQIKEIQEIHSMRYYFLIEVKRLAESCGFSLKDHFEFMTNEMLSRHTWGSCFVLEKGKI